MRLRGHSWWSGWSLLLPGMGGLAGLAAWVAGPRLALAVVVGIATAIGLVGLRRLRAAIRRLETNLTAHDRAAAQQLAGLVQELRDQVSAAEQRLVAAQVAQLGGLADQLRDGLDTVEKRIRIATSGDLAALEKRLRQEPG